MLRLVGNSAKITTRNYFAAAVSRLPYKRTFTESPFRHQASIMPLGGTMFSNPVANLHGSTSQGGVKKLPVDDDVLITRQQAKDLIYRLHQKERRILLEELELYNTLNQGE